MEKNEKQLPRPMGRSRRNALREARIMILEALFASEYTEQQDSPFSVRVALDEKSQVYRDHLWNVLSEHRQTIDVAIGQAASGWSLERMAKVDRNILRIATAEILFEPEVPFRVSVDEALELAHQYCEPEAVSFINGILHQIGTRNAPLKVSAPVPSREDIGS